MRAIAMAFLFCINSTIANAESFQATKPVLCDDAKKVLDSISKDYNERLTFVAKDAGDKSRYILLSNEKTGSWTLIQMTAQVACILGVGEDFRLILGTST